MTFFRSTRSGGFRSLPVSLSGAALIGDPPDDVQVQEVARALWVRKWHILACGFFIGLAFFSYAARLPVHYAAEVTLLLEPRNQPILSDQDQIFAERELTNASVESEVARLGSAQLMRSVIVELGPERFRLLDPQQHDPSAITQALDWLKRALSGPVSVSPLSLVSENERYLNRITAVLSGGLLVERVAGSHVIHMRLTSRDPVLSAEVANALAAEYIARQGEAREDLTQTATRWLSDQVALRRTELAAAENAIGGFKQSQLEAGGASQEILKQRLAELNRQLAISRVDGATAEARVRRLETQLEAMPALDIAQTLRSDFLSEQQSRHETLQAEISRLSQAYGADHPERQRLAQEVLQAETALEGGVQQVLASLQDELAVFQTQEVELAGEVRDLEQQLVQASRSAALLRQLQSEAEIARESYETLVARLGETRAQMEIQQSEARVLSPAQTPTGPSAPRPKLLGAFGVSIGLSLGFLSVLAFEALGRGFSSASELARASGTRVLASVPEGGGRRSMWVRRFLNRKQDAAFHRQVAQVRSLLHLQGKGGAKMQLVLPVHGGKRDLRVVRALAAQYAGAGEATLLLLISEQAQSASGLTRGLFDEMALKIDEIDHSVTEGIELARHVQEIGADYDRVLIVAADTSTAVACHGAVSARAEALILVQWRVAPRQRVRHVLTQLAAFGVPVCGLVLTSVDPRFAPELV